MVDKDEAQQQPGAEQQNKSKTASSSHLNTSGAASLAAASSVPPPFLSRPSLKSSASQAQGQKATPTLLVDLSESTQRLRLSPSPSRPRSLLSLATEEGVDDQTFQDGSIQDEEVESSGLDGSPSKVVRSALLTRRLRSAIGEDLILQKELLSQASNADESRSLGGHLPFSEVKVPATIPPDDNAERSTTEVSGGGWGWSAIATIPSSLRMEAALNTLRGPSKVSSEAIPDGPSSSKAGSSQASTEKITTNQDSSFGSYMRPLDVRRWWASPTVSSRSSSKERAEASSKNGSERGGEADNQSVKSVDSSKYSNNKGAFESPLKGLPSGSFPSSSIAKRNQKKREQLVREAKGKGREASVDVKKGKETLKGRESNGKHDAEILEHDLSSHTFGVEADQEKFPEREYLVLSTAGKPIYVSYVSKARLKRSAETKKRRELAKLRTEEEYDQDEAAEETFAAEDRSLQDDEDQKAATKVGVLQALISNYEALGLKELQQRSLDLLELPKGTRICYLLKPPLYLVAISRWGEEESTLRNHLDHLYLAIISLVTASKLSRLFDRAANFDLKRLLDGTDGILDTLLTNLQTDATSLFGSLQPLRIDTALRIDVGSALIPSKDNLRPQDALYALLLCQSGIVTLARRKRKSIHPIDCHLLINTVYATKAMKDIGTQSWVPICLPKFAAQGFLYAHVSFLEEEGNLQKGEVVEGKGEETESEGQQQKHSTPPELALVLVTSNPDGFGEMSQWRESIVDTLQSQGLLNKLNKAVSFERAAYSADELRLPGLRHFIFKWRSNVQSTSPQFEDPYTIDSNDHKRLVNLYGIAYHYIHSKISPETDQDQQQSHQQDDVGKHSNSVEAVAISNHPSSPIIRPKSVLADINGVRSSTGATPTTTTTTTTPTNTKKKTIPISQHLIRTSSEIIFAWSTQPFELYLTVSPHLPQNAILSIAKSIVKWVKQEEHRLFIVSAPVF